jgi:hypothetical protein
MKVVPVGLIFCGMLSGLVGQEGSSQGDSSGPKELAQLRRGVLERTEAGSKVNAPILWNSALSQCLGVLRLVSIDDATRSMCNTP